MKKIKRKCVICGKQIIVEVKENGRYKNGHYFGKMNLPVKNTGIYKKVGTTKLLGRKSDVVKWSGLKKEIEYWECNKCYKEE